MEKKVVLFISPGGSNAACAALLVRAAGKANVEAFAAYTSKKFFEVDRTMVKILAEDGLDLTSVTPLSYGPDLLPEVTHVINLSTAVETDKPTYTWRIESSDGQDIRSIRQTLDTLRWNIKSLLEEI